MEKPKFIIGNEERFSEFVAGLKNAGKIIAVSHTDLDGLASAKVIDYALDVDKVYMVDYHELDEDFIKKLEEEKPSHIVITDLLIRNPDFIKRLSAIAKILIIDHHVPETNFNSDRVVFMNAQGFCAGYLAYYLFSKIKNMSKIDWLVACSSISDIQYRNNAGWMQEVYAKYGCVFDINDCKKGKFWDLVCNLSNALIYYVDDRLEAYGQVGEDFGEIGNLKKFADEVQKEIDLCLDKFEKEKKEIEGGYFWEFSAKFPVKSIVSTIIGFKYPTKTILMAVRSDKYYLSARRQDRKIAMNALLQKLISGFEGSDAGGHVPAAGGHILLKDAEEFKKRLKNLQNYL